jgi:hypothetical protein
LKSLKKYPSKTLELQKCFLSPNFGIVGIFNYVALGNSDEDFAGRVESLLDIQF